MTVRPKMGRTRVTFNFLNPVPTKTDRHRYHREDILFIAWIIHVLGNETDIEPSTPRASG